MVSDVSFLYLCMYLFIYFVHMIDISGKKNCLVNDIPQNIFFCVLQKKDMYSGLKQH